MARAKWQNYEALDSLLKALTELEEQLNKTSTQMYGRKGLHYQYGECMWGMLERVNEKIDLCGVQIPDLGLSLRQSNSADPESQGIIVIGDLTDILANISSAKQTVTGSKERIDEERVLKIQEWDERLKVYQRDVSTLIKEKNVKGGLGIWLREATKYIDELCNDGSAALLTVDDVFTQLHSRFRELNKLLDVGGYRDDAKFSSAIKNLITSVEYDSGMRVNTTFVQDTLKKFQELDSSLSQTDSSSSTLLWGRFVADDRFVKARQAWDGKVYKQEQAPELKITLEALAQTVADYNEDNVGTDLWQSISQLYRDGVNGNDDMKTIEQQLSDFIGENIDADMIKPILQQPRNQMNLAIYLQEVDQVLKVGLEAKTWRKWGEESQERELVDTVWSWYDKLDLWQISSPADLYLKDYEKHKLPSFDTLRSHHEHVLNSLRSGDGVNPTVTVSNGDKDIATLLENAWKSIEADTANISAWIAYYHALEHIPNCFKYMRPGEIITQHNYNGGKDEKRSVRRDPIPDGYHDVGYDRVYSRSNNGPCLTMSESDLQFVKDKVDSCSHNYSNVPHWRKQNMVAGGLDEDRDHRKLLDWINGLVDTVETCEQRHGSFFTTTGWGRWKALEATLGVKETNALKAQMKEILSNENSSGGGNSTGRGNAADKFHNQGLAGSLLVNALWEKGRKEAIIKKMEGTEINPSP